MRFPLAVFSLWILLQASLLAEPIRQPPELQSGDKYRLAFVTSTTTTAESTDIETYNAFVQATADASPIGEWGLEWMAIAGTEAVSARENTGTAPENDESVPIFLLNGTELVPNYSALWNAWIDVVPGSFDINETGEKFGFDDSPVLDIWTGSGGDGLPRPLVEGGPLGAGTHSTIGLGDISSDLWINATVRPHDWSLRMYAMSEILTAVPEPSSEMMLLIGLLAFTYRRSRGLRFYRRAA